MTEMRPYGNRSPWLGIFVFCLFVLRPSPGFSDKIIIDGAAQFDFALACMDEGEYQRAVYEFERFVDLFPDDPLVPKARLLIGICRLEDRSFERARETFQTMIASGADEGYVGRALFLIGESYYRQGLYHEAAYYFTEVIEKPFQLDLNPLAVYRLAWTRLQADRWQEASEIFKMVEKESSLYDDAMNLAEQSLKGRTLPFKKPGVAGALAVIPGLGHVYVSRYRDAGLAFVLNGLFVWAAVESFEQDHTALGGILTALELGWYTGNIYSAVNCAHKTNRKIRNDFRSSLKDYFDLTVFSAGKGSVGLAVSFRF